MPAAPKVFISYSHDSEAHKARVLNLADRLRHAGGIEAIVDQYIQFPAEGWPLWCEKQIDRADFVLMVCTDVYLRRVRNEEIPGAGRGVLWEAQLIRQELYDSGSVSAKFVPVRFADGSDAHIPRPVRRFSRYVVDTADGYEALYRYLTNQPATPPPQIAEREMLPPAPRPGLADAPVAAETAKSAEPALSQPHPRVEDIFAGREKELGELADCLFPTSGRRRPVAVGGMGGVGKSYLVDRFYWQNAARFPGGYLRVALDAAKPGTADDLLATIAERLKLPAADRGALAARLLAPLTLLHVENVDTLEAGKLIGEAATRLAGCALVASARLRTLGAGGGWGRVEVEPFDEAPALDQLAQELGADAPPRGSLAALVRALGQLPLALHLAAGYLRMGDSPEIFLDRLRGKGLALEPIDPSDPTFHERSREALAKTFELSLDALGREGGRRAKRWRAAFDALGYAPAVGFGDSLGAAVAGLDPGEFRSLTLAAVRLSLLERVAESGGRNVYRLHPLLAELGRVRAKKDRVIDRMTEWFVARLPEGGEDQGRRWREVHDETAALIEWLPQVPGSDRAPVEHAGSWYAMLNGPYRTWLSYCEQALADERDDSERSHLLWTLAYVAIRAGDHDRGLAFAQEKRQLDAERGDDRGAALGSSLLADIAAMRGDLEGALRIRKQDVLPAFERAGDERMAAVTWGEIADVLAARGDLDEALRIRREEQLPVYERLGDVRAKAVAMGKIADVLHLQGQLDEAVRIPREEQLPILERLGDVPALLRGRRNLALTLLTRDREGDREAARRLLCSALDDARRLKLSEASWIEQFLERNGLNCD